LRIIIANGGVDMNKIKNVAKIGVMTAIALMPVLVLAQTLSPLPLPTSPYTGEPVTLTKIQDVITSIAKFLIIISMVIAVIFIVWGGISYMTAGDDASRATAARSRIINGIIGALVVLAVGLILQTLATVVDWNTFFNI